MFYGGKTGLEEGKIWIRSFWETGADGLIWTAVAAIGQATDVLEYVDRCEYAKSDSVPTQ
jgi:hypothetical protein